ncbi:hypothetical protein CONLIGDRAFT_627655 [Coniochaeta ligniaria NRRL 30616]|uniref:Uncharacterized protein n=1 Tax=Coniochaeta ligniaria NRRL 30616 TaxID=1408157 RepID=A0A1J7JZM8_9PEZI|nr:hypothetical protein CONLIGDRAFT_627655 [Coniochaeta ligniaria NRRL 30616]
MSTKRVASKTALASLQSVDIATLPETEKSTYFHMSMSNHYPMNSGSISNIILPSVHYLLQRLWRREPGRNQRGTSSAA